MSFNIRHGVNKSEELNLMGILKIIKENKPDLIALQAVDSLVSDGKIQFQLRQLAIQTGMHYTYGIADRSENGSQGVGILSVWPLEKSQIIGLPNTKGSDPKILLCGLIRHSRNLTFRFCNSRLEYASVMDRALQAAYINQMLGESVQPVLLGVDMGARPNEQPYFSFRKRWRDAGQGSLLETWNEGIPGDRLDYIFVLLNNKVRVKNYKVIRNYPEVSDHYPILATVDFGKMNYSHLKIGLFIPCYVDQFYPQVGVATLELLEKLGCTVGFPLNQTCCGQPMANSGFEHLTKDCNRLFYDSFADFDYVVSPSGSCVLHIKDHLKVEDKPTESKVLRKKVYELVEFITDVLKIDTIEADFPHRVGLHQGCHGQRGLHLSQMSELNAAPFSKPETLLRKVHGLELIELDRKDECCGFGGTFCVSEEAVSVKMGKDRVADHLRHDAEYITGSDMSCLLHLEGILRRRKSTVQVKHIAEILNNSMVMK